jgi:hypothetical protein
MLNWCKALVATSLAFLVASCPPPGQPGGVGPSGPGAGTGGASSSIRPDSCGAINVNPVGRKMYSFLVASAELDQASFELEGSVTDACRRMATILGVNPAGSTRDVCARAAAELEANLQVSVRSESRLVTRHTPSVCRTEIDFAAGIVAECEARSSVDINVTCDGRCSGTCNGACSGLCSSGLGGGQCNGQCDGTCSGRCTGGCDGYANVEASAECKASAEIRTSLHTTCTEPKVEIVRENVTVVDDSKFQKAVAAIEAGLPQILRAAKRLELASKALVQWVQTGASLVRASGDLIAQLGERGLCVGGQLAAVLAATANIEARFSVSIEFSARISASAGAQ